jgi:hypothetical protein
MKSVRIRGIIGSTYLIIYYIIDAIYCLNSFLGKEYLLTSSIVHFIGIIIFLSAFRSIFKNNSMRTEIIITNILILILLIGIVYRIIFFFVVWLPYAVIFLTQIIPIILSIVLCIRMLSIRNENFSDINKIKTFSIIYLSIFILLITLGIFKVGHLIQFPQNFIYVYLVVPYIYSIYIFRKIQFNTNGKINTCQNIEVDTSEKT